MKTVALFFAAVVFCFGETIAEFIEMAKAKNPEIQYIKESISAAKEDVVLSKKYENPMMNFGVNDISINKGQAPMQSTYVMFSQKIPIGEKLNIASEIESLNLSLKELLLFKKEAELAYRIKSSVYKIKKLENDLKIIQKYEKIINDIINMHTAYNIESNNHYQSNIKSKIIKTKLDFKKTKTKNQIEIEKSSLKETINEEAKNIDAELFISSLPNISLLKNEINKNIDLLIKQKELEISLFEIKYSKSEKTPDITLGIGYMKSEMDEDYLSLSATIPLNIYDKENIEIAKKLKQKNIKDDELMALKNKIENEITTTFYNIKNSKEEYELLNTALELQSQIIESLFRKIESKDSLSESYEMIREVFENEFELNMMKLDFNLGMVYLGMLLGERK